MNQSPLNSLKPKVDSDNLVYLWQNRTCLNKAVKSMDYSRN